jgi:periplasmic divalent cation tolerance protein
MIYATFPNREAALAAAHGLVEHGLAAAVNLLHPVTSIFVWKGKLETADETVLVAKLTVESADRAVAYIVANHPYETPGVLVIPVAGGNSDYLAWIRSHSRTADDQ